MPARHGDRCGAPRQGVVRVDHVGLVVAENPHDTSVRGASCPSTTAVSSLSAITVPLKVARIVIGAMLPGSNLLPTSPDLAPPGGFRRGYHTGAAPFRARQHYGGPLDTRVPTLQGVPGGRPGARRGVPMTTIDPEVRSPCSRSATRSCESTPKIWPLRSPPRTRWSSRCPTSARPSGTGATPRGSSRRSSYPSTTPTTGSSIPPSGTSSTRTTRPSARVNRATSVA